LGDEPRFLEVFANKSKSKENNDLNDLDDETPALRYLLGQD